MYIFCIKSIRNVTEINTHKWFFSEYMIAVVTPYLYTL